MLCVCVYLCIFCCSVDSYPVCGLLPFPDFSFLVASNQWFPSLCLWNLFLPCPQESTSLTSKYTWVCLLRTNSRDVVFWSQPMYEIPGHKGLLWAKCHLQTQKAVPLVEWPQNSLGVKKWERLVGSFRLNLFGFFLLWQSDHSLGFAFSTLKFQSFPGELWGEWSNCLALSKQGLLCHPDSKPGMLAW